jgi:hypothetical protein
LLKILALLCVVSYAYTLPIERNIYTGFHHWVLRNPKLSKVLTQPSQFVTYKRDKIIYVDLNMLPENYRKKFIEPNTDKYFENFIKQTEEIINSMMSVYKMDSFKTTYHFQLGSVIYPKEVFYFFICKIS